MGRGRGNRKGQDAAPSARPTQTYFANARLSLRSESFPGTFEVTSRTDDHQRLVALRASEPFEITNGQFAPEDAVPVRGAKGDYLINDPVSGRLTALSPEEFAQAYEPAPELIAADPNAYVFNLSDARLSGMQRVRPAGATEGGQEDRWARQLDRSVIVEGQGVRERGDAGDWLVQEPNATLRVVDQAQFDALYGAAPQQFDARPALAPRTPALRPYKTDEGNEVLAAQLDQPFEVTYDGGVLSANAGDWLIQDPVTGEARALQQGAFERRHQPAHTPEQRQAEGRVTIERNGQSVEARVQKLSEPGYFSVVTAAEGDIQAALRKAGHSADTQRRVTATVLESRMSAAEAARRFPELFPDGPGRDTSD